MALCVQNLMVPAWSHLAGSCSIQRLFFTKSSLHRISVIKIRWSLTTEIVNSSFTLYALNKRYVFNSEVHLTTSVYGILICTNHTRIQCLQMHTHTHASAHIYANTQVHMYVYKDKLYPMILKGMYNCTQTHTHTLLSVLK